MPVEIIGMVATQDQSETRAPRAADPAVDADYLVRFAQAHERSGFDRVLIGYGATHPDGWMVASHVLHRTETLKVLVAHRPGFAQPTLVARTAATIDNLTGGGRVAVHLITGGDEADQRRDGDFVGHDDRYGRTAEAMGIFRRVWNLPEPFDYRGSFYRYEGAFSTVRPSTDAGIPLYFGGASAPAIEVGAKYADVYMLWGEPLDGIRERIAEVNEAAGRVGRTVGFSVSTRPILADTEEGAWARAEEIGRKTEERVGRQPRREREATSVGGQRLLAHSQRADVLDERLWTRVAQLTGAGYNTTAVVGTPEQVAEALLGYYDLGVSTLLIRGFDPLDDAVDYGRELIPLLREGATKRDAQRSLDRAPIPV